ncbi:hypothetical protein [Magnetospirillum molischianum]|uniref:Uncharacterized protein n=1 Tax=Magnetospirillum molischianum DSM 120 TaxID=1150626 RepID=H8FVC1_MAGML|nr:hypothetical protein [Magnetospirillum molischianum]CCG42309.1 hypothetical protein PHAMO_360019 [Magnetospirillum molischianum DSM 120]
MSNDDEYADPSQAPSEFVLAVAKNLEQKLSERLANEPSERQRVLTEVHLLTTIEAVKDAILTNPPYSILAVQRTASH